MRGTSARVWVGEGGREGRGDTRGRGVTGTMISDLRVGWEGATGTSVGVIWGACDGDGGAGGARVDKKIAASTEDGGVDCTTAGGDIVTFEAAAEVVVVATGVVSALGIDLAVGVGSAAVGKFATESVVVVVGNVVEGVEADIVEGVVSVGVAVGGAEATRSFLHEGSACGTSVCETGRALEVSEGDVTVAERVGAGEDRTTLNFLLAPAEAVVGSAGGTRTALASTRTMECGLDKREG